MIHGCLVLFYPGARANPSIVWVLLKKGQTDTMYTVKGGVEARRRREVVTEFSRRQGGGDPRKDIDL
jgi:hypothetical protein